jgi:hypothetical protein
LTAVNFPRGIPDLPFDFNNYRSAAGIPPVAPWVSIGIFRYTPPGAA